MFEIIEIQDTKSPINSICNCKNTNWNETTIEVKPIIAGGLILAWEIEMGIECTQCNLYALKGIGVFNDKIELLKDFPSDPEYVEKLNSLNLKGQILTAYENLRNQYIH